MHDIAANPAPPIFTRTAENSVHSSSHYAHTFVPLTVPPPLPLPALICVNLLPQPEHTFRPAYLFSNLAMWLCTSSVSMERVKRSGSIPMGKVPTRVTLPLFSTPSGVPCNERVGKELRGGGTGRDSDCTATAGPPPPPP